MKVKQLFEGAAIWCFIVAGLLAPVFFAVAIMFVTIASWAICKMVWGW